MGWGVDGFVSLRWNKSKMDKTKQNWTKRGSNYGALVTDVVSDVHRENQISEFLSFPGVGASRASNSQTSSEVSRPNERRRDGRSRWVFYIFETFLTFHRPHGGGTGAFSRTQKWPTRRNNIPGCESSYCQRVKISHQLLDASILKIAPVSLDMCETQLLWNGFVRPKVSEWRRLSPQWLRSDKSREQVSGTRDSFGADKYFCQVTLDI